MAESFVLRYPLPGASSDEAEWMSVDGAGAPSGAQSHGSLSEAAAAQGTRRLIAIVPGEDVALSSPELPARSGAKLPKLVPYALEEQLASDIDTLHFAVGRQGADRRVPVAALERARLTAWLAELSNAGLSPAMLVSDALVVPQNPSHVIVVIDRGRLIVRQPDGLPVVLDAEPMDAALALAGVGVAPLGEPTAQHVIVYATAAGWEAHSAAIEHLRDTVASVKVQLLADGPLPLLAAGAVNAAPWNLLQGDFAVRQGFADDWPRWRTPVLMLAAVFVLHLAALGLQWFTVHREELKVDQALTAAAHEALPNIQNLSRLPSIRAAVESRVHATRSAVSEGLVGTLGALAAASRTAPGAQISALSYREGTTDLTLDAPDVGALDRMREAVRAQGLSAELQGATQHDTRYQGRLQLKGPG